MKSKIISVILATVTLLSSFALTAAADEIKLGDVNFDGTVDAGDARSVLRYSVNLDTPSEQQQKVADADNSGTVTSADARLVLRMSVGLEEQKYYTEAENTDSEQETLLKEKLPEYAHKFYDSEKGYGAAFNDSVFNRTGVITEKVYGNAGKWCCFYTIHDVFRPALKLAGYSDERIEELAPIHFSRNVIATAVTNIAKSQSNSFKGLVIPSFLILEDVYPFFIPSVLANYYRYASSDVCTMYTFREYYDDTIESKLIKRSENASSYKPEVGDVVFMSNKTTTYYEGYPTIDHTAQIIEVYSDGSFLCTEGSIILKDNPDENPRVRERVYKYNSDEQTYFYTKNKVVFVLACAKPNL